MNVADELALRRQLFASTKRERSRAQLRAELMSGCQSLGELAEEWLATGHLPEQNLAAIDRTLTGLGQILVALRAQGGPDAG